VRAAGAGGATARRTTLRRRGARGEEGASGGAAAALRPGLARQVTSAFIVPPAACTIMGEQEQGAVLAAPGAVLARDTGCTQLQAVAAAQSGATSRQLFCSFQV